MSIYEKDHEQDKFIPGMQGWLNTKKINKNILYY